MIKLLNDEHWHEGDLIDNMYDDDFYYSYLGTDKCLSSSSAKVLYSTPGKFFEHEGNNSPYVTKALRDGKLIHTLVLEKEKLHDKYDFVDVKSRSTKTFDEADSATSKDVMLSDELEDAEMIADMVTNNEFVSKYFTGGQAEVPGIGMISGVPFRAKADYLFPNLIVDLKTTSNLEGWIKAAKHTWHYDIQGYIYCEIFGVSDFVFIVVDKKTYNVGIFPLTKETKRFGSHKLDMAIYNYKTFQDRHTEILNEYTIKGQF